MWIKGESSIWMPNGMDNVNDAPISDPFLCLDTDLDDVSEVIRSNWACTDEMSAGDLNMWPEMNRPGSRPGIDPLLSFGRTHDSPQQLRDPNTYKEIGSIVSLLQEDDHMLDDAQNYHHFMNESLPLHSGQSLLPSCSVDNNLASNSQYSRNAIEPSAFSYSHYQGSHFVESPSRGGVAIGGDGRSGCEVKEEKWHSGGEFGSRAHNTKQELLDLIATMTPAEVEHLRASRCTSSCLHRERHHPMAVGVATKMPSTRPKTERRTAHNLIEKKYRCSINDRIQCLKTMLSTEDAKMCKSATLRKAIEHISALRHENEILHREVERLRLLLKANRIEEPSGSISILPSTSLTSTSISSQSSPDSSECSPTSAHPKRSRTMVDKSRVTMLAFMFALVIWNPVSLFIDSSYAPAASVSAGAFHSSVPGRSLQQVEDAVPFDIGEAESVWWRDSIVRPCFVWSVNVFIIFCFLTRVLVYGEPVADVKSSSWTLFLNTKSAADRYIQRGNYNEAARQLRECLRVLERPLPTTGFDKLISVLWQVIRHLLNSVWIGRWFARRKRSPAKPVTVVCRSHAYTALIYHQLHQLHLIGAENTGDGLTGLNLALSAVNLAESAGCSPDGLSHAHRADIYLNAALRVKITLPAFTGVPLFLYFMRRARRHARCAEEVRPLERLTAAFKLELLTTLLTELSNPITSSNMGFVDISHLLLRICTAVPQKSLHDPSSAVEVALNVEGDELCTWWTHVFTCALYWKHSDNASAHKHYTVVRKCPRQLLNSDVSLAVGHAFCSRKLCADDRGNRHFTEVVWAHATRSFSFLQRIHLEKKCTRNSPTANAIHEIVRSISLEWLLMSVLDVWHSHMDVTKPYWEQSPITPLKQLYEQTFTQFRAVAHSNEHAHCKVPMVAIYELASRMLNAANPVSTWREFVRVTGHQRAASVTSRGRGVLCCQTLNYTRFSHLFQIDILLELSAEECPLSRRSQLYVTSPCNA
uniref:BHLH domain-containing protein n=1 Tax=Ascaris lumbricoides TaxID=6252 RepID=A0A9J2PCX5_ASCLU